jgi:hypothetical protein
MNLGIVANGETGGETCAAHWGLGVMSGAGAGLC